MRSHVTIVMLISFLFSTGCTQVVVRKDPTYKDKGIRYWRPKPYLFIGPAGNDPQTDTKTPKKDTPADTDKGLQVTGEDKTESTTSNFVKISMSIKYLPDYNEEYSIRMTPGLGVGRLDLTLQDGWNLTTVGIQQDQQTAAIITSVAGLLSAARGGTPSTPKKADVATFDNGERSSEQVFDATRDVPLGFYEPIIAIDGCGRKHLFGWRYVGFMPFSGCPVEPCIGLQNAVCDPHELWGISFTKDSLRFQRLSEMEQGIVGYGSSDGKTPDLSDPRYNSLKKPTPESKPESLKGNPCFEDDDPTELPTPSNARQSRWKGRPTFNVSLLRRH